MASMLSQPMPLPKFLIFAARISPKGFTLSSLFSSVPSVANLFCDLVGATWIARVFP